MVKLHIIQADQGDCLIMEFGTVTNPRYILIDGGPASIYERHLRGELQKIRDRGGRLDLVILSHVDIDHIVGLLDLVTELREQEANKQEKTIAIDALWHNAFDQTIGNNNDIGARLKTLLTKAHNAGRMMTATDATVQGIREGDQLRRAAILLKMPINPGFTGEIVSLDNASAPITLGNVNLSVVGPTKTNLEEMEKEWLEWLEKHENSIATEDPSLAAMTDQWKPNLSSIMVLADVEGKKVLFAGDGRGDHLLQGLGDANLLDAEGTMHVDVLKVPHHGSSRNVTREFFKTVTADTYIISANGMNGNPDLATLIWIVEAAREQGRTIKILVTNEPPSVRKLIEEYDPDEYGYELTGMKEGSHVMTLEITP